MTVLLDSTVLIDALRSRQDGRGKLARMVAANHALATSAANVAEVYGGMRPGEESATQAFLSSVECYPVTAAIARRAGDLQREWRRRGRTLTMLDMMVAATALEYGFALATENRKDFPMPELVFQPLN